MLKNYLISSIRVIRRSGWLSLIKILTVAGGIAAGTVHTLIWICNLDMSLGHLIFSIFITLVSALVFELSFRKSPRGNEFSMRVIFGENDPDLKERQLIEALLLILVGSITGVVIADTILRYNIAGLSLPTLNGIKYGSAIIGIALFQLFLFIGIAYSGLRLNHIKRKNSSGDLYSKFVAGFIVIVASLVTTIWAALPHSIIYETRLYFFDSIIFSWLGFVAWHTLAILTLSKRQRVFAIMKLNRDGKLRILFYWFKEIGFPALITIILTVLSGTFYLGFVVLGLEFIPILSLVWFIFSASIIILGAFNSVIKGLRIPPEKQLETD